MAFGNRTIIDIHTTGDEKQHKMTTVCSVINDQIKKSGKFCFYNSRFYLSILFTSQDNSRM